MPDGVMPIQRLGLQIGEGSAQVLSFPEVSRDLEYMRARRANEQAEKRQQERDQINYNRELLQSELDKLDDTPMWYTNERYYGEVTSAVEDARNTIFNNMEGFISGDPDAVKTIHEKMALAKNKGRQTEEYKKQAVDAMALALQEPKKWSKEQVQRVIDFSQGKIAYEDMVKDHPTWNWGDKVDIEPIFKDFVGNFGGLVSQEIAGSEVLRRGSMAVSFEPNINRAVEAMNEKLIVDPTLQYDIASYYQTDIETGKELFLAEFKDRVTKYVDDEVESYKPLNPKDTGTKITPQQIQYASEVKRDVNEAVNFGDVKSIERHLQGYGTNVMRQYLDPFGKYVSKIPEGKQAEDYIPVAKFFERKLSENAVGEKTTTEDNLEYIILRPGNYGAILNKISTINEDISKEAIQMEEDPKGDLDTETARIAASEFTKENRPTPEQFTKIFSKMPKGTSLVGPDGVTYVKRK